MATAVAFFLLLASTAYADATSDADDAYRRGDPDEMLRILRTAAKANDPKAQMFLGRALTGSSLPPEKLNNAEGIRWLRASAENNFVDGQIALARAYHFGRIVPRDLAQAARWYRKAAENGRAKDQDEIGRTYWYGKDVPQDIPEAMRWFLKAAEGGFPDARLVLGTQYALGQAVPRDYVEARRWFLELTSKPVRYPQAPREYLGTFYLKGLGVPIDYVQARRWFEEAAEGFSPYSEYLLGELYEKGLGVTADVDKAMAYYRSSAFKRFAPAQYKLGVAYLRGEGVPMDSAEALKWLAFAIELDPSDEPNPSNRARQIAAFERDPAFFHLNTGHISPAAYEYALDAVRRLSKDPTVLAKARSSAAAFQPVMAPVLIH